MANTLAIHWPATTYGTWLHGNPRGSWRNGRSIGPDPRLEAESQACMAANAIVLDDAERKLVALAFGELVGERSYRIFAATIQPTHVHLIIAPLRENLDDVIARFKRRASMAVL